MIYFAHNGVTHVDAAESSIHVVPQLLGVVLVTVILLFIVAKVLSHSDDEPRKEDHS